MTRSLTLKAVALALLAVFAGAAFAFPDALQALAAHADIGGALALAWGPVVRSLQEQHAAEVGAMTAISAALKDRDLTADEQAKFDGHKAKAESLKARIATAQATELAEAGVSAAEPAARGAGTVTIPATAQIQVQDNVAADPQGGFRSAGEFACAVIAASTAQRRGAQIDQRLLVLGGVNAAAPSTFGNEASGADGGWAVPVAYGTEIFSMSLEEQALLPLTDNLPVEGNSMSLPKDETTPWGTTGVRAHWQGEAGAGTPTKPVLGRSEYKLKKLLALVPMSEELMADATAMAAYLPPLLARSIRWKTDEAILFGTGVGTPLGGYTAPLAITVAKESSGNASTLLPINLAKMVSRLTPGGFGRSRWLMNNDVLPYLWTLNTANQVIYTPDFKNSPFGALLGRPIIVTQHAKSFGTLGDIMLADFGMYQSITKAGGIQTATSMHLYFDADSVAFRATFRVDGQPKIAAAVSPANGSNTLSPFVQLEAR